MNMAVDLDKVSTDPSKARGLPRYFARSFELIRANTKGVLDLVLPDGRVFRSEGQLPGHAPSATLIVNNPDMFGRILRDGNISFGESFMDGWWRTPDLQAVMDLVQDTGHHLHQAFPTMKIIRAYERLRHRLRDNTRRQARRNIEAHYDLGNDFYSLWLDETMTYSSAYFTAEDQGLSDAQRAKYQRIVDMMAVQPGDHVLEIGCGWGGFAEYAAGERGLNVTGLTLSPAQLAYARDRMDRAGLSDQVTLKLCDYRDEDGQYDGIASIEMFEAVGEKYWPAYFQTLKRCLRPGRRAALQIITLHEDYMAHYRRNVDFIQKYIFPGGMLPSTPELRQLADQAGLSAAEDYGFKDSYSKTLRIWDAQFQRAWPEIEKMGFDDRFHRMWRFYLCASAGAFRSGNCDIRHLALVAEG